MDTEAPGCVQPWVRILHCDGKPVSPGGCKGWDSQVRPSPLVSVGAKSFSSVGWPQGRTFHQHQKRDDSKTAVFTACSYISYALRCLSMSPMRLLPGPCPLPSPAEPAHSHGEILDERGPVESLQLGCQGEGREAPGPSGAEISAEYGWHHYTGDPFSNSELGFKVATYSIQMMGLKEIKKEMIWIAYICRRKAFPPLPFLISFYGAGAVHSKRN